ncbi:hypothetical protein LCGC14_0965070 [marine sediment metagenome]|uniref:Uncharacterized protein n=1 Tax=marine sediment metagenome TaxID=412755 RepID=A0A0F9NZG9_9ZZZZ
MKKRQSDTKRLNWLKSQDGVGLISDDAGRWAVSDGGMQNMPDFDSPIDISTVFTVDKADWRNSIREAIDVAMAKEETDSNDNQD